MRVDKSALVVIDTRQVYFAGEPVFMKHLPGSCTGTPLEETLRAQGMERVIVAGFMTQMCVETTSRQAAHLGFNVTVLSDATAAKRRSRRPTT